MSNGYVPSDAGRDEDRDGVHLQESTDNELSADVDGNGVQSGGEEAAEEESAAMVKIHTWQNSKKVKKSQPKASDYGEDVEAPLNHAVGLMQTLVMLKKPMPSVDKFIDLASDPMS